MNRYKAVTWALVATLAIPAPAVGFAGGIPELPPLVTMDALPYSAASAEKAAPAPDFASATPASASFSKPAMSAADGYQLVLTGSKFATVYEPTGSPIATFDLSLNHLTWSDILLGAIAFGDLSLGKLAKLIKKIKNSRKEANDSSSLPDEEALAEDADAQAALDAIAGKDEGTDFPGTPTELAARESAMKRGMKVFGDLRLSDRWAIEHGAPPSTDGLPGVPFRTESFTLADIQYPDETSRSKIGEYWKRLAQILYPEEKWDDETLQAFAGEFEFRYNAEVPGYDVFWNRSKRENRKAPHLPGVVANYYFAWQNLIFKYNLFNLQTYGEYIVYYFGVYGMVVDYIVSRLTQNLTERLDYHENQLLGLLGAHERFETESNYPAGLVDGTMDLLYLNKFYGSGDPYIVNGMLKRKRELYKEERALQKTRKGLAKIARKKNVEVTETGGAKFAVARSRCDGSFKGIYAAAASPYWPTKIPAMHVHPKAATAKVVERYLTDVAAFVARDIVPNNIGFSIWKIAISIRIDPWVKDDFVRARVINETRLEGELSGLLDEAIAGRLALPLSGEEAAYSREILRKTYINPFKQNGAEEADTIARNLALLQEIVGGGAPEAYFTQEKMVPLMY